MLGLAAKPPSEGEHTVPFRMASVQVSVNGEAACYELAVMPK